MNKANKKRNFVDVFLKENHCSLTVVLTLIAVAISIALANVVGSISYKFFTNIRKILKIKNTAVDITILGFSFMSAIAIVVAVASTIIYAIIVTIRKNIALYRYCHIPLSNEEIDIINTDDKKMHINCFEDYLSYIKNEVHYRSWGKDKYVGLDSNDVFKLLSVTCDRWDSEIFDKKFYIYCCKGNTHTPYIYEFMNEFRISSELKPWVSEKYGKIIVCVFDDRPYVDVYFDNEQNSWFSLFGFEKIDGKKFCDVKRGGSIDAIKEFIEKYIELNCTM